MFTSFRALLMSAVLLVLAACSGETSTSRETREGMSSASASNIWIIYDQNVSNAAQADLSGMIDCVVNNRSFNDLINSFNSKNSPWSGIPVRWNPQGGAGGVTTTAYAGQCGQLYAPDAQCLTNIVLNDPNLGQQSIGEDQLRHRGHKLL
jgi:hypothetical protein